MHKSFKPYSPSNNTEQGKIFFWSQAIACTKLETAAPGAYQAEVPNKPVSVAPPTLVSCKTCANLSSEINSEAGTEFLVANRVKGTIPLSECPPITIPSTSEMGASKASANRYLKRAESKAPPIPMILFLGSPVVL